MTRLTEQVDEWIDDELPGLNRAILGGDTPPGSLTEQVREVLLPHLPAVGRLSAVEAQRLVVRLGFVGASVARHYQEWTPGGKATPERAFDGLAVGAEEIGFQDYFAALAERTGTGHYGRDSFASLVRWNVGTVRVLVGPEVVAVLPGVFDDGRIRSYTGTPSEERFFVLVKQGEAVELAVNDVLDPLTREDARLLGDDAVARLRRATDLIMALRRMFLDFAALPPDQSMPAEQFMDVFRQFAVHWTTDDIPPSGALDPEALKRDFLLGVGLPGYDQQVSRLLPALLGAERVELEALMARPTLPDRLLTSLGLDAAAVRDADEADLRRLVGQHPALVDWYRLLTAHARAAGAHLMLSKKFLFKPQHEREAAGLGDRPLVSNRAGTTGMNETFLERLTRARREHPLAPLHAVLNSQNSKTATDFGVRSHPEAATSVSVVLAG
ncbi:hypothetical protein ACWKSP_01935 [Micromonosporaceae bacterium Da 78-11]